MKLSSLPLSLCLGLVASIAVNGQIAAPSVGYVRYATNEVHAIYGLEGNYVVGEPVLALAKAVSFSDQGGLILQSGSLTLVDSNWATLGVLDVDDDGAIIRVDGNLQSAIAWLPVSHTVVHWNGTSFQRTPVPVLAAESGVTSVRKLDRSTASLLTSKPDGTVVRYLISLQTGVLNSSAPVPGISGYAWEEAGTRVFGFNERKLSVVSQTGETFQVLAIPVDRDLRIEQASNRCLHVSTKTPGQDWLLHLDSKDLHPYQMPRPRKITAAVYGPKPESAR